MPDPRPVRAFLEPTHLKLAAELDAFARKHVAPLPPEESDAQARVQARQLLAVLGKGGLFRHALPQPDLRACCLAREALAAASPLADAVFALQALGSMPVVLGGAPALKKRWLAAATSGAAMAAFAMTEPEAGSDVAAIRTTAKKAKGGYVLQGAKHLISNAGIADFYAVFASTNPKLGAKGLSCFLVEGNAPGFRFVKAQVLSAPHPLGEISFRDCWVPASALLGKEGEGLKLGLATLDRLRPTVAAAACGMAARALAEAKAHVLARQQFGKPLAGFQLVQEKFAMMATELAAARLLVYRAAWEKDTGAERIAVEGSMAKAFACETAQRVVDGSLQLLGGRGCLAEHPVERLYRAVRALRVYEGTTEIQHLVIAGHLLKEDA